MHLSDTVRRGYKPALTTPRDQTTMFRLLTVSLALVAALGKPLHSRRSPLRDHLIVVPASTKESGPAIISDIGVPGNPPSTAANRRLCSPGDVVDIDVDVFPVPGNRESSPKLVPELDVTTLMRESPPALVPTMIPEPDATTLVRESPPDIVPFY